MHKISACMLWMTILYNCTATKLLHMYKRQKLAKYCIKITDKRYTYIKANLRRRTRSVQRASCISKSYPAVTYRSTKYEVQ